MFKKINLLTAVLLFKLVDFSEVGAADGTSELYGAIVDKSLEAKRLAKTAWNEKLVKYKKRSQYAICLDKKKEQEEARNRKRSWCERFFCCARRSYARGRKK